jgi:putative colanic acid biosynthesis UDP-glucose lipid carrier transferase
VSDRPDDGVRLVTKVNRRITEPKSVAPAAATDVLSQLRRSPIGDSWAKRAMDILGASIALLVFLPLLMCIALAIRLESGGPVIFKQRRTGHNGRIFTIYKFRTMTVAEDCDNVRQATRNDSRVTEVGALLRKLSLDELPQFLNILKGDMSIVGPRPHALAHDSHFGEQIPTYADRFRAKPGLTGLAQVNGLRGEINDLRCMTDRIAADNLYIESWSIGLDVAILGKTALIIFSDPQAY